MKKKYIVNLSDRQRQMLTDCIEKEKRPPIRSDTLIYCSKRMLKVPGGQIGRLLKRLGVISRRCIMCVGVL